MAGAWLASVSMSVSDRPPGPTPVMRTGAGVSGFTLAPSGAVLGLAARTVASLDGIGESSGDLGGRGLAVEFGYRCHDCS